MMYEHIVAKLREKYKDMDASFVGKHFAIQFNVWGEGHGALYMEIKDGHIFIEPYEYFDRDTLISTDADTLLGIASGKIDPTTYGDLYVEGNFDALEILKELSYSPEPEEKKEEENEKKAEKKPKRKRTVKKSAEGAAELVKEKAGDAVGLVKGKAGGAVERVKEKAEDAAEAVIEKAEDAAGVVKEKTESVKKVSRKKRK